MKRARLRGALALACLAGSLLLPRRAAADTEEGFFYSDDAALVGGAVTAWTRDAGAVWYNPAGLAETSRMQLSINGTIYALKIRKIPDALRTTLPGVGTNSIDISSTDIMSAPHATAIVRAINDHVALGIGIYITQRDVRTASNTLELPVPPSATNPADARFRQHLDMALELTKYQLGPAIGWRASENLRFGANVLATYTKTSALQIYEVDVTETTGTPPATAFGATSAHVTLSEVGIVALVGMQWEPARAWHVGATVRTPELRFSQSTDGSIIDASAAPAPAGQSTAELEFARAQGAGGGGVTVPPRVVLGLAHDVSDRVIVSAEADFLPRMTDSSTRLSTRAVVNGRAGVRVGVTDTFYAGLGVFTDRDRNILTDDFLAERVDRLGFTAGLQLLTPFTLDGDKGPRPSGLTLATTVSLRYAAGVGEVRALDIAPSVAASTRTVGVLFHELTPYIGTAIAF